VYDGAKNVAKQADVPCRGPSPANIQPKHGWGGIRTHERLSPLPVFKTGAFNRSATHPEVDPVGGDASPPSTNRHFAVSADCGLQEPADFASQSVRSRPRPIRTDILTG
jgi:hypothetical protein